MYSFFLVSIRSDASTASLQSTANGSNLQVQATWSCAARRRMEGVWKELIFAPHGLGGGLARLDLGPCPMRRCHVHTQPEGLQT